ncbi:sensor histidine kinase [Streptomyces cylindrosporus]|uniref:histidine kinase n=1 Tax=Streptomyces cylindrosporus TaxID=2927583 RepID=A0ABS9YL17_9ACTN|nr:nitrate- and nitrite sensing domain-containing protein [Streptomyces cylindrosporus]MCI3277956.1 nitrate- and nitrite sensing domain-containing protein [Streptomyces cylindrosporus]
MSRHRVGAARTRSNAGRGRSIRASLIALAVVPAAGMALLWASGSALQLDQWHKASNEGDAARTTYALIPGVSAFQEERRLTIRRLSAPGGDDALEAQRRRTDAVLAAFHKADAAAAGQGSAQYRAQLKVVRKQLTALTAERTAVDKGKTTRQRAYDVYSDAVASALNLFGTLSSDNGNAATASDAAHALAFMRGTEALSQEGTILDGAVATGRLSVRERTDLSAAAAVRGSVFANEVVPYLPSDLRTALDKAMGGPDWAAMTAAEKAVAEAAVATDGTVDVPRAATERAAAPGRVSDAVQSVQGRYLPKVTEEAEARTDELLARVLGGSALALVAVLAVGFMSWRITRSLIGRMAGLRAQTLELAQDRLPELITRLRTEGSRADIGELPELDYGTDELGKVAEAFNSAQRTAVSVALEQASLREGARLVFHNMSRRIQILVHRQLTVIDGMERKEQNPQQLADLYRVDHLATRMRRNAESLTVLSGAPPRRRWKQAVPLGDVLRSAVSEIEGYARVVVEPMPPVAVAAPAVGDVIHLMAELIENGVTFSPPHTEVRVRALPVAQGYAVEVEDRGLGLSAEEYEAANELLHEPKDFSFTALGQDPRLGLFTVGHLAHRHAITAGLQASSYGGTLAVVVLPHALTEPAAETMEPLDPRAERHLASVTDPSDDVSATTGGLPRRTRTTGRPQPVPTDWEPTSAPTPTGVADGPASSGPPARQGTAPGDRATAARRVRDAVPAPPVHEGTRTLGGPGTPSPVHEGTRTLGGADATSPVHQGVRGFDRPDAASSVRHGMPTPGGPAPAAPGGAFMADGRFPATPSVREYASTDPAGRPAAPGGARPSRLPRRVRQASLAPQLRERPRDPDGGSEAGRPAPERRPEQARSMLAALRDGTRRARAQEEVPAPVWPSAPSERRPLPTRNRPTRNTP